MSVIGETEVAGEARQGPLTLGEPLECCAHAQLVAVGGHGLAGAGVEDTAEVMGGADCRRASSCRLTPGSQLRICFVPSARPSQAVSVVARGGDLRRPGPVIAALTRRMTVSETSNWSPRLAWRVRSWTPTAASVGVSLGWLRRAGWSW